MDAERETWVCVVPQLTKNELVRFDVEEGRLMLPSDGPPLPLSFLAELASLPWPWWLDEGKTVRLVQGS